MIPRLLTTFLALAAATTSTPLVSNPSAAAAPQQQQKSRGNCGTKPDDAFRLEASRMEMHEASLASNGTSLRASSSSRKSNENYHPSGGRNTTTTSSSSSDDGPLDTIQIPVYFHVIANGSTPQQGMIPQENLTAQLATLNRAYSPHDISFELKGVSRTINPTWSRDGDEYAMKNSLRQGSYADLNIYFLTYLGGDFGYCYYPTADGAAAAAAASSSSSSSSNSTTTTTTTEEQEWMLLRDGCSILYSTVPGGSVEDYNLGHTATHEIGHWMGLMHTFEGQSCDGPGDSVRDTPQEGMATSGCPKNNTKDSCPGLEGLDPVHNYMDYSNDYCYEEFTQGQETRMYNTWNRYRAAAAAEAS